MPILKRIFRKLYPQKDRLREIDFLRGIAVILVLFRHHPFSEILYTGGWIGVDLFFVLSGYLVSQILFKEFGKTGKVRPLNFLFRRGFKIYPLFYFAILLTVFIEVLQERNLNLYSILSELFFVQNYYLPFWNHTWTLAVEEHFYILLSISLFFLAKKKRINNPLSIIWGIFSLLALCLMLRFGNYILFDYTNITHLYPTHLRLDSLLFGVLLSYLHFYFRKRFELFFKTWKKSILLIASIFILPAFIYKVDSFFMNTIGLTMLYLGFGSILGLLLSDKSIFKKIKHLIGKKITLLVVITGFYSYGIYLFHMFIPRYLIPFLHNNGYVFNYRIEFLIYFFISIGLGILVSLSIEHPFLKLREKLTSQRKIKAKVVNVQM